MAQYSAGALHDENGGIVGGRAGDQGGEVTRHALTGNWTYILRPPKNGAKMAWTAAGIAKNQRFGYDQGGRKTGWYELRDVAWDPTKVTVDVEMDCSSVVSAVCNSGGYAAPVSMWTGDEISILTGLGFTKMPFAKSKLKVGDILWRKGHTEVYIGTSMNPRNPGSKTTATAAKPTAASKSLLKGGTYRCNAAAVNVRNKPTLKGAVVAMYRMGQTVKLDEWSAVADGYVWGRYTGATSGEKRYVAVGRNTGKAEKDDLFVRVG